MGFNSGFKGSRVFFFTLLWNTRLGSVLAYERNRKGIDGDEGEGEGEGKSEGNGKN